MFCIGVFMQSCGSNVNTNINEHFTEDGFLITDSLDANFKRLMPSSVKFYVEVSGSMNGFFLEPISQRSLSLMFGMF